MDFPTHLVYCSIVQE